MINSVDSEKACVKIHHPFKMKALKNVGIDGLYLSVVKAAQDKPTANAVRHGKN
jgi:hypothetical protein